MDQDCLELVVIEKPFENSIIVLDDTDDEVEILPQKTPLSKKRSCSASPEGGKRKIMKCDNSASIKPQQLTNNSTNKESDFVNKSNCDVEKSKVMHSNDSVSKTVCSDLGNGKRKRSKKIKIPKSQRIINHNQIRLNSALTIYRNGNQMIQEMVGQSIVMLSERKFKASTSQCLMTQLIENCQELMNIQMPIPHEMKEALIYAFTLVYNFENESMATYEKCAIDIAERVKSLVICTNNLKQQFLTPITANSLRKKKKKLKQASLKFVKAVLWLKEFGYFVKNTEEKLNIEILPDSQSSSDSLIILQEEDLVRTVSVNSSQNKTSTSQRSRLTTAIGSSTSEHTETIETQCQPTVSNEWEDIIIIPTNSSTIESFIIDDDSISNSTNLILKSTPIATDEIKLSNQDNADIILETIKRSNHKTFPALAEKRISLCNASTNSTCSELENSSEGQSSNKFNRQSSNVNRDSFPLVSRNITRGVICDISNVKNIGNVSRCQDGRVSRWEKDNRQVKPCAPESITILETFNHNVLRNSHFPINMNNIQLQSSNAIPSFQFKPVRSDFPFLSPRLAISSSLRPIAIDGSNVAYSHGQCLAVRKFSCKGIELCVDYFLRRGHGIIKVFVPTYRKSTTRADTLNVEILDVLEKKQIVVFTPSRNIDGRLVICYDDRFVLEYAAQSGAVVVSNDNYRDLKDESSEFRDVINNRLLMYTFVDDLFMVPKDPLGRYGPKLDSFLSF